MTPPAPAATRGRTWQSVGAELLAWALAFVAWGLSFAAQAQLAGEHGFAGAQALLWPAGTDLAALSCMLLAQDGMRRGLRVGEVWALTLLATVVMIAANVVVDAGDAVGAAMHAWPPVIAIGIWHALVHGRRPRAARRSQAGQLTALAEGTAPPASRALAGRGRRAAARPGAGASGARAPQRGSSKQARARVLLAARLGELDGPQRARVIAEVAAQTLASASTVRREASRLRAAPRGSAQAEAAA